MTIIIFTKKAKIFIAGFIFFISLSFLMYEILMTRLSKIFFADSFDAILIISMVVLGLGTGAILLEYILKFFYKQNFYSLLALLTFFYSVSLFPPIALLHTEFAINSFLTTKILYFILVFIVYSISGMILALIYKNFKDEVSIIYFFSTLGSAIGSFSVFYLLNIFSLENLTKIIILLSFISLIFCLFFIKFYYRIFVIIYISIFAFFLFYYPQSALKCTDNNPNNFLNYTSSNSYSYVSAYIHEQYGYSLVIDCFLRTKAVKFSEKSQENLDIYNTLTNNIFYFPYEFKKYDTTLVVGAGGGIDVIRAILGKSEEVTAVEINPLLIDMSSVLTGNENVYKNKNVKLEVMEARNFITRTDKKFDLIYIATAKRYGSLGIKNFIFLENYLFTKEAFSSYLDHLNKGGILFFADQKKILNYHAGTIVNTLVDMGIDPISSVIFIEGGPDNFDDSGIMIKKDGFSEEEISAIDLKTKLRGMLMVNLDKPIVEKIKNSQHITDDKPYYWFLNNTEIFKDSKLNRNSGHYFSLKYLLFVFFVFIFFLLISVFIKFRVLDGNGRRKLLYFILIGMGYMLIEITLINKFTIFLVNPVHALSIILTGFLSFGAIGGYFSSFINDQNKIIGYIKLFSLLIFIYFIIFVIFIGSIYKLTIFSTEMVKILSILSILAAPSFLMGFLFPLGMKTLSQKNYDNIPYFLGVNGLACVAGGILAFILSLFLGFTPTLFIGSLFYLSVYYLKIEV